MSIEMAKPNAAATGTSGAPEQAALPSSNLLPEKLDFKSVMTGPLVIPRSEGHSWLDVIRTTDQADAVELLLDVCERAPAKVNLRWAGGCKGFSAEQVEKLFEYVARGSVSLDGSSCFQGAVGSGGTMDFAKDGSQSVMICQVPYYMARVFPCVAWGSTPSTYRLRLDADDSGLIVSRYGAKLDPNGHMNVLTQTDAKTFQGWDGDVRWYIGALASMQEHGYKVGVGVVNGGDVTKDEALLALSKGVPVVVVNGTGRAADELAKAAASPDALDQFKALYAEAYKRGLLDPEKDLIPTADQLAKNLRVVSFDNPRELSLALDEFGLLTPIQVQAAAANA